MDKKDIKDESIIEPDSSELALKPEKSEGLVSDQKNEGGILEQEEIEGGPGEEEIFGQHLERMVSVGEIKQTLEEEGCEMIGNRESLSSGAMGPICRIKIRDNNSGKERYVVEKTFVNGGDSTKKKFSGQRFTVWESVPKGHRNEIKSRLGIVNKETGEVDVVVIDWLYNEEKALKELGDIPGIPKSYGAVYDGLKGSILEEYIDGYDSALIIDNVNSREEIFEIFKKIKETYIKAAERGYIYNGPDGSTVMVDKENNQPYLIDWYNHSEGEMESDGPVRKKYEDGLKEIMEWQESSIKMFDDKQAELVRQKIKNTETD